MESEGAHRKSSFENVARWRELARRCKDGQIVLDGPDKVSIIGMDRKSAERTIPSMGDSLRSAQFDAAYTELIRSPAAKDQSFGVYVGGLLVILYDIESGELISFADEMAAAGVLRN